MITKAVIRVKVVAWRAQRDNLGLNILGIVAEIFPRLSAGILAERVIDCCNIGRRRRVGDTLAEDTERVAPLSLDGGIPANVLPRVVWVGPWITNGELREKRG